MKFDSITEEDYEKIINKLKKISSSILKEESEKDGIQIDIGALSKFEYYKSELYQKKWILQRIKNRLSIINTLGFYEFNSKKIIIFTDNIVNSCTPTEETSEFIYSICLTIFITYHEYKHALQFINQKDFSYEQFVLNMEFSLMKTFPKNYKDHHDEYFLESEADLYAFTKSRKYLEKNFPSFSKIGCKYLQNIYERKANYYHNTYDFQGFFNRFYHIYQSGKLNIELPLEILDIFFDKNKCFKKLPLILEDERFPLLDKKIFYEFLGSEPFIQQLDFSTLTVYEKNFMFLVFQYQFQKREERLKYTKLIYQREFEKVQDIFLSNTNFFLKFYNFISMEYFFNKQINELSTQKFMNELEKISINEFGIVKNKTKILK